MKQVLKALALFVFSLSAKAASVDHQPTVSELTHAIEHNQRLHQLAQDSGIELQASTLQPVPDTSNFSYVLMSADEEESSEVQNLRKTIAQNLPQGVRLVILSSEDDKERMLKKYSTWIDPTRLILATDSDGDVYNGFWARDSFPVPVFNVATKTYELAETQYFRDFRSGPAVAKAVHGRLTQSSMVFVGGNLLADEDGNCFSVNSERLFDMSSNDFKKIFGCRQWHSLPHVAGIGDVDEVLKPLTGKRILTNQVSYKAKLEGLGYQVIMLPALNGTNRTYANTLIVGQTVFMPAYGVPEDQKAIHVYESLGYHVIPITSNFLSDQMDGSIHCQTMAYPEMDASLLMKKLGLKQLR